MTRPERPRLVISEDDLPPSAPPPVAPGAPADQREAPIEGPPPVAFPTVEGVPRRRVAVTDRGAVTPGFGTFVQTIPGRNLSAAAAGVTLGWAVCEITRFALWTPTSNFGADVTSGAYVGAVGLFFVVVYAGWEQILAGNRDGVLLVARRVAVLGAALAFVAGFVAQVVYHHFLVQILQSATFADLAGITGNVKLYLTRALAWGLFGLGMGVAAAGGFKARERTINGLIGGGIGGALGGLVFHWASFNITSDTWARLVGLLVVGASIGLAIGLVEKARREAWMQITGGGMAGKEFILYGAASTFGSSPSCEINLIKDSAIEPYHFAIHTIEEQGRQVRVLSSHETAALTVNGRPVSRHRLRSGDVIGVGGTTIAYSERESV